MSIEIPTLQVSCGALLRDDDGRVLILKPTYKKGWTIPGGMMESDGESPWDACRREVLEETGLEVARGRLAVVDTKGGRADGEMALRYLFDCGTVSADAAITLQEEEISKYQFAEPAQALEKLRPRIGRRVQAGLENLHCVYLENGRRVDRVG